MHPSRSWDELVSGRRFSTRRRTKPGSARKFMLDGRHTGTGGGNHIVIGGETPQDSPTCAPRPAALAARVLAEPPLPELAVQRPVHRPHLAGPRVDEARNDSLDELEIAFAELDRNTGSPAGRPPGSPTDCSATF